MNNNIKSIVILGRSDKFISLIKKIFPESSVNVVSWRNLEIKSNFYQKYYPDLVVVCGYDYSSSWYSFGKYMKANVYDPAAFIENAVGLNTIVLYVDTGAELSLYTYSRYRYAKNSLGLILAKLGSRFRRIELPVLLNENGTANVHGGFVTRLIFNLLIKFNLITTTSAKSLNQIIIDSLQKPLFPPANPLMPKLLKNRRSLFIDRVMRILCG